MKKTSLVIMAAGIGSRFGGGIKQLAPVGPSGEIIMDYSIHDALEAGFDKIIFIIRKDLEKDFKEIIGNRIEKIAPVEYAYQEMDDLPEGFSVPEGRTKPWGTGQAILAARNLIKEPFLVINADDYYGIDTSHHLSEAGETARGRQGHHGGLSFEEYRQPPRHGFPGRVYRGGRSPLVRAGGAEGPVVSRRHAAGSGAGPPAGAGHGGVHELLGFYAQHFPRAEGLF